MGGAESAAPACASTIPATANRAAHFTDGTIGRWLEDSLAVFDACCRGPQVVVGSSMGGWLALLLVRALRRAPRTGPHRSPAWC